MLDIVRYTLGHEWINTQIDYFRSMRLLPPGQGTIMLSGSCPGVYPMLLAGAHDGLYRITSLLDGDQDARRLGGVPDPRTHRNG